MRSRNGWQPAALVRAALVPAALVRAALVLGALATGACATARPPAELAQAERLEKRGDDAGALAAWDGAVKACPKVRDRALRRKSCAQAMAGRAFALERLGREDEALAAWLAMAKALAEWPDEAGRALHEAAQLELRRGHDKAAYDLYWRVIVEFPDISASDDALRVVVRDGRRRNAAQLDGVLAQLWQRQAESELGDNLLAGRADLAEHELTDPKAALGHWDTIAERYPKSPLFDDALWHGARLARAAGDPKGALVRLRKLLATRETAFIVGSYHSVWLDESQLEVGRILRDDLADPRGALAAFEQLGEDYPDSILRDDALWELAQTRAALGDGPGACRALAAIAKKYKDSRFLLEDAPALAARLGCTP